MGLGTIVGSHPHILDPEELRHGDDTGLALVASGAWSGMPMNLNLKSYLRLHLEPIQGLVKEVKSTELPRVVRIV